MFSRTTEYALRAAAHLAYAYEAGETVPLGHIAERTLVPPDYLSKVLQNLVRAGIVHSQRGTGGGFRLVKPPQELSVLEVVQAVEPINRITTCPLGLEAHGTNLCPLHRKMDDALALIESSFGDTTLAQLTAGEGSSQPLDFKSPLCAFPS